MIIRKAVRADHDSVIDVWKRSWDSIGISNAIDRAVTAEMLRDHLSGKLASGFECHVAEDAGRIIAMLVLDLADNHIDQLFVAPEAQSRGIGRALLAHAQELMPAEIWLSTAVDNVRACRWYEREGFKLEGTRMDPVHHRQVAVYLWTGSG